MFIKKKGILSTPELIAAYLYVQTPDDLSLLTKSVSGST